MQTKEEMAQIFANEKTNRDEEARCFCKLRCAGEICDKIIA